jgi:hypothetical protein
MEGIMLWWLNAPAKRILNAKPGCRRKRGISQLRWKDGVGNEIKVLGEERIWKDTTRTWHICSNLLRKAMTQKGLFCQWWWCWWRWWWWGRNSI